MKFFQKEKSHEARLKIIPLGGTTDVTKNLYIYETPEDILVVDCGIGYPGIDVLGVDVLIPDISYLIEHKDKVRGILISHGHEDHFGALPYILPDLNVPVYATKLVLAFIESRLRESNFFDKAHLFLIEPEKGSFRIGNFSISPFFVNHSVPDSLGFCIDTPEGRIFHVSDFKFDFTPVTGHTFEIGKVLALAKSGVLAVLSDCLGSNSSGFTSSEREIEKTFEDLIGKSRGRQVIITTISSNISRIQQAISVASRFGRKVVPVGRSLSQSIEIAQRTGYLSVPHGSLILDEKRRGLGEGQLLYLVAGAYAQPGSAMTRLAESSLKSLRLQKGASVIFSADPIPGVYDQVDGLINKLIILGADVYYSDIQENLHVSGHGSQGDLQLLASLIRPKYFIPIGGTPKFMRSYTNLISSLGFDRRSVLELGEGQVLEFRDNRAIFGEKIPTETIYIDGLQVGSVRPAVLRDRKMLANDGVVLSILIFSKEKGVYLDQKVVSRGFVFAEDSQALLDGAKNAVRKALERSRARAKDFPFVKSQVERHLLDYFFKEAKRKPLVAVEIVEI